MPHLVDQAQWELLLAAVVFICEAVGRSPWFPYPQHKQHFIDPPLTERPNFLPPSTKANSINMLGHTASAYVLLALGLTAAPVLAQHGTIWDEWANFYDDIECSEDEGISVSLNNDGCLNQRKYREG